MSHKKHVKENEPENEEIDFDFSAYIKKYYPLILLGVFIILGFSLRYYHVSYPMIGYHNWKSAHYVTEARNFEREGFFKYGFFIPMRDTTENFAEQSDGAHPDTFPTISIVVAILFKIFGESIVIARMANILFTLASVVLMYLIVKGLFEREDLALVSAFLTAISPLFVFFSHNIDVINPAIFFMLLGTYFFVLYIKNQADEDNYSYLYLAAFFVIFSALTKYSFLVIAIPMAFAFPYKKFFSNGKGVVKPMLICTAIVLLLPLWYVYTENYVKPQIFGTAMTQSQLEGISIATLVDFSILWKPDFWDIMRSYAADNYTLIGVLYSIFGLLLFLFFFMKNHKKIGYKFMMGYFVGVLAYLFIMGFKLSGHSYHQYPVAPALVFFIAYFFTTIATNLAKLLKNEHLDIVVRIAVVLLFIFIIPNYDSSIYSQSIVAKNRMFDTQFPGLDIAGDYINSNAGKDDRVFHSGGQDFGYLWHADRKGYKQPGNSTYFEIGEADYNVSWVFAYQGTDVRVPWGFKKFCVFMPDAMCDEYDRSRSDYLRQNYRLVQIAFISQENQFSPIYLLFRKGGNFSEEQINGLIAGKQQFKKTYELSSTTYDVGYINIE